ncbi:MAG: hypothetical protein ACYC35_17470, partial [Pirellulales bacterium]
SGLAVAAALVVMFLNRPGFLGEGPVDKGRVAIAPSVDSEAAAPAKPEQSRESLGREEELLHTNGPALADKASGRAGAVPAGERTAQDARLVRKAEASREGEAPAVPEPTAAAAGARVLRIGKAPVPPTAAAPAATAPGKHVGQTLAAGKANTTQSIDAKPTVGGMGLAGEFKEGKVSAVGGKARDGAITDSAEPFREGKAPAAPALKGNVAANRDVRVLAEGVAPAEPLLVVQCEISPQAARTRAFDSLLLKQQIVLADTVDKYGASMGGHLAVNAATKSPTDFKKDMSAGNVNGDLDLVYVEASPQQIEATMASLQAQPNLFLAVKVAPGPSAATRQTLGYYRWEYRATGAMKQAVPQTQLSAGEEKNKARTAVREKAGKGSPSQQVADQPAESSSGRARRAGVPAVTAQRGSPRQPAGQQKAVTTSPPGQSAKGVPQAVPETMRVLFVLRTVAPPAADASIQLAKPAAEAPTESTGKAAK